MLNRASVLLLVIAVPAMTSAQKPKDVSSHAVQRQLLGCLTSGESEPLKDIGLHANDIAWVRFHSGSIRGLDPTPDEYQVAVYTKDIKKGWLLLAYQDKDSIVPAMNAYQLTFTKSGWEADEGNGGLATYAAMSRFANSLSHSRLHRMKLRPAPCK